MKRSIEIMAMPTAAILIGLLLVAGCTKKDSGGSDDKGAATASAASDTAANDPTAISGQGDGEAVKALSDELARRWLKTPDGWISEYPAKTYLATGERAGPESFYREIKQLKFNVQANELSESDKLNGIQFQGLCQFEQAPVRIYGDPNAFGPPAWSQWKPGDASVRVEKKAGKWAFGGFMGELVTGTKPSANIVSQLK